MLNYNAADWYTQLMGQNYGGPEAVSLSQPVTTQAVAPTPAITSPTQTVNIDELRSRLLQDALGYANSRGVGNTYQDLLQQEIDRAVSNVQKGGDPASIDGRNIASTALSGKESEQRSQLTRQADELFGRNYGSRVVGSNLLDNAINDILNEQKTSAQQFLDRGTARGIFNERGQQAGMNTINQGAEAGRAQLSNLASGIIDKYRSQADEVRDDAYNAANTFQLGRNFDFNDFVSRGNEIGQRAQTNANGELLGAFGGTNLFDFSKITNTAGQAQGAQNLRDTDVATALAERKRRSEQGRGLGSQGVF
jgi:hypothetical protein